MYTKNHFLKFILLTIICALLAALTACTLSACSKFLYYNSDSDTYGDYRFELANYDVVYEISSDRKIHVTEDINVHFMGRDSTGFYRDIPINGGERVKNIAVYNSDGSTAAYSVEMEDSDFVSLNIGTYSNKTDQTVLYKVVYDYEITKVADADTLYLNPIGYGWDCVILNATVKLVLPQGYVGADYYIGSTTTPSNDFTYDASTNTITATVSDLVSYTGVTFALKFEQGSLSAPFTLTPFIVLIIAVLFAAMLAAVKFLAFGGTPLTPVVNFTAPNDLDPLMMGKLIDNKVNSEDVTSLIYYWANKGYLKINLSDENNPSFIRIYKHLPDDAPSYQRTMYNEMFNCGGGIDNDVVSVNQLQNKFYTTIDRVTADVNAQTKNLYTSKSVTVSVLFGCIGALLMGLLPIIVAMINTGGMLYLGSLVILIPAAVVYMLTQGVMYNKLKISHTSFVLSMVGTIALAVLCSVFYVVILPEAILDFASKIIVCIFGFAMVICSVSIVNRTQDYTEKLNMIIGFRNFILYTEKDKLEAMLEDDPQFYYEILPYAQVLGVTDKWAEKFKAITLQPPAWVSTPFGTYLEFAIINRSLRNMTMAMVRTMLSRPSSSGRSGGSGGSIGGFGGGGHGGGGGRGR